MSSDKEKAWFGVRSVFLSESADQPAGVGQAHLSQLYEERITLWFERTFDEALKHAEQEAESYAEDTGSRFLGLLQAYESSDDLETGAEVFSLMRSSTLGEEDYLKTMFATGFERQQT